MNKVQKENKSGLMEMYNYYQTVFKESGCHPHPANLLAMLLLKEKDKFEPLKVSEGVFYRTYQELIDSNISKVLVDFQMEKEEMKNFIEENGVLSTEESFEHDKIWYVFADGFGILHGELMYHPRKSSFQIYQCMNNQTTLYKDGVKIYPIQAKKVFQKLPKR